MAGMVSCGFVAASMLAAERLDRGAVAFPAREGGVYIGWRLLADDKPDAAFDVFSGSSPNGPWTKANAAPITTSTNFVDGAARGADAAYYTVQVRGADPKMGRAEGVRVADRAEVGGVFRFKLNASQAVAKAGIADFDGDGRLDYLVRAPDFNGDPFYRPGDASADKWRRSPETLKIEAYRHDGTFLWRHDLGWAVETGTWYAPIVAYDLDGDGKAEVYCKGGGAGDPRDEFGRVTSGPEYLLKLDGQTGKIVAKLDWPSREGFPPRKGNEDVPAYNRYSRNILGIAYLDGKRPHLIVQRGKYTDIKLRAYDPALKLAWQLDITAEQHPTYRGAGMHGMQVVDVDGDGRDELLIGAALIGGDGKPRWTTQRGHPDGCYVGDLDPARPGLEVYYHHEWPQAKNGVCMVDARTGETIWGYAGPTTHVHSTGLVADLDPTRPGLETYGGETNGSQFFLFDAKGTRIGNRSLGGLSPKALWWDASATKVIISESQMFKLKPPARDVALTAQAASVGDVVRGMRDGAPAAKQPRRDGLWDGYVGETFGKVTGTVIAVGDFFGDWREEFVVSDGGEVRVYSSTIPTETRRVTWLQDRKYRTSVALQTMGYLFVPIAGDPAAPK